MPNNINTEPLILEEGDIAPTEWVLDIPRESDYIFSDELLFGAITNDSAIPFPLQTLAILNQNADRRTYYACSRFALTHIVNGLNILAKSAERTDPKALWEEYLVQDPSAIAQGATLQSALDQFRAHNLIVGYSRVKTIEEAKIALDIGHPIYTGSANGDWQCVKRNACYATTTGKTYGHIFALVGYDETGFIGINSFGAVNGIFTFPYKYWDTLFSRYAITSPKHADIISHFKNRMDEISAQKAYEAGLISSARPNDPITRYEMAIVLGRMLEKTGK